MPLRYAGTPRRPAPPAPRVREVYRQEEPQEQYYRRQKEADALSMPPEPVKQAAPPTRRGFSVLESVVEIVFDAFGMLLSLLKKPL